MTDQESIEDVLNGPNPGEWLPCAAVAAFLMVALGWALLWVIGE